MSGLDLRRAALLAATLALSPPALAAGPEAVASIDRARWPLPVHTPREFDAASFAENALFARAFLDAGAAWDRGVAPPGVKAPQPASIDAWRRRTRARLVENLGLALGGCAGIDPCGVRKAPDDAGLEPFARDAAAELERRYPAWAGDAARFYETYAREQLRLAALFPSPTSEILPLTPAERLGDELPDRTFQLTFDDGPTAAGGETDRLADWLRSENLRATFFVLQDALRKRADAAPGGLAALYAQQCVGSHGASHVAHPKLAAWRASVDETRALVLARVPGSGPRVPFRPPYGQRTAEQARHVEAAGDAVVLWNVDSQDWNAKLAPARVGDRVLTLMLLWRRGIVLFHDVHPRAREALPGVVAALRGTGVVWRGCREE